MISILMTFLLPTIIIAHSGKVSPKTGCHKQNLTNPDKSTEATEFHCHQGSLKGQTFKSEKELEEALQGKSVKKLRALPPASTVYSRKNWQHWIDQDKDCQDTRAEILVRDNKGLIKWKSKSSCRVVSGVWFDPYTGKTFTRAKDIDIDHVVPLKHAYSYGAAKWSKQQKKDFANDPQNLLAVSVSANRSKGAKGPSRWLPPNKGGICEYLKRWKMIKDKYKLKIGAQEQRVLANHQKCGL